MQTNNLSPFFTSFPYEDNDLVNLIKTCVELKKVSQDENFYDEIVNRFLAEGRSSYQHFVAANTTLKVYALHETHTNKEDFTRSIVTLNTYAKLEQALLAITTKNREFILNNSFDKSKFLIDNQSNTAAFLDGIENLRSLYRLTFVREDHLHAGPSNVWSYLNPANILTYEDTIKHKRDYRKYLDSTALLNKYYNKHHPGIIVLRDTYEEAYKRHNENFFVKRAQSSLIASFIPMLIIAAFFIVSHFLASSFPFLHTPWLIYILAALGLPLFLNIELIGKIVINVLFAALYAVGIIFNYITITNYALFLIGPFTLYFINSFFLLNLRRVWGEALLNFIIGLSAIYLGYLNAQLFLILIGGLTCGSFVMGIARNPLKTTFKVHMTTLVALSAIYSILYYFGLLPFFFTAPLTVIIFLSALSVYILANIMYSQVFTRPSEKRDRVRFLPHFFVILSLVAIFVFLSESIGAIIL